MSADSTKDLFEVFDNLKHPGAENISVGKSIEAQYVRQYFKDLSWHDLTVSNLRENYSGDPAACLSFMTPEAFRFYFPGFMKIAVTEYSEADAIFDTVISKLKISALEENSELRHIFEKYDLDHKKSIAALLVLISENYCKFYPVNEAALSLDLYWKKYLQ